MLRTHSHFSILKAYGTPKEIVQRAIELGYNYCALTDYKSISGCIDFYEECKKNKIKPILGCDFGDFTLLAKNKAGWNELILLLSQDAPEFKHSPNLIVLEHSLTPSFLPESSGSTDAIVALSVESEHPNTIVCRPSYYLNPEDKEIHQILIATSLRKSIPKILKALELANASGVIPEDLVDVHYFFGDTDYSMQIGTAAEQQIADACEEYNILSSPRYPKFECPDGLSEIEYLKELCREGWKQKLSGVLKKEEIEEYKDRVLHELKIIERSNLAGYFLIVRDFIDRSVKDGVLPSWGRGSAPGCLVSYLTGITGIDPIKYGLIFERFYDSSRAYPKHISFPEYRFVDDFRG